MPTAISPLLTIVVTSHCRPKLLAGALQSIRDQGDFEVEIILADDAGCAETRRLAAEMLSEKDVLISRPGMKGPAESRNIGIELARAPWIGFLDDDDRLVPGWFAALEAALADPTPRVIFGDYLLCNADGSNPQHQDAGAAPVRRLRIRNMIHSAAFVMPRCVKARFEPALRSHEDWDFLLSLYAELPFQYLPVVASEYRAALAGNRNNVTGEDLAADYQAVYERHPVKRQGLLKARQKRLQYMARIMPPNGL